MCARYFSEQYGFTYNLEVVEREFDDNEREESIEIYGFTWIAIAGIFIAVFLWIALLGEKKNAYWQWLLRLTKFGLLGVILATLLSVNLALNVPFEDFVAIIVGLATTCTPL